MVNDDSAGGDPLAQVRARLAALDEALAELPAVDSVARTEVARELERRAQELRASAGAPEEVGEGADAEWHGIVGASKPMLALRDLITRFANASAPVLVHGESGTGKELVARCLHDLGPRASRPFLAENCAAIPETLLESVLFGHKRGAFTGAVRDHPGHFVAADKGTLFLDEIGDMPAAMQAKLLRVLQDGEVRAVGGEKTRKVDVRVVAASHRDLERCVRDGTFREDLLYRLAVLRLDLPPLRERGDDVVLLARRFLTASGQRNGRALRLSEGAEDAIRSFAWPGNVRQLQNEMQRAATLTEGSEVGRADLSAEVAG